MRTKRKIFSLLLAICLVVGLIPTAAFAADNDKAIQLGASNISGYDSTNGYDYIYYGEWDSSPIKWRVLDTKTNMENAIEGDGLFLLSDVLLGTDDNGGVYFDNSENGRNKWQNSTAQTWCKNFHNDNFSSEEQSAVLETTKSDTAFTSSTNGVKFAASNNILNGDNVFFLSAEEAENSVYGFTDDNARKANYGNSTGVWWLRSPYAYGGDTAGVVDNDGSVFIKYVTNNWTVRPAFNLNLNSVLFTSAAKGGKIPGSNQGDTDTIFEIADYTGNEWKLTLLDNSRNFSISNTTINSSGNIIGFSYSGAQTGANEYISVVIEDSGKITHYGRILQLDSESGTASLTLPAGVTLGSDTKLYVFNEQYNGGANDDTQLTDYASQLKEVSNPTADTTAPTLTGGGATRDSENTATVKFTSGEAGTYYYSVVDSGAVEPDVDTSGTGTSCDTAEQTISLISLTAGAKDIYIVVKDAAGNVSGKLKITIPAYVPPQAPGGGAHGAPAPAQKPNPKTGV